MALFMCRHPKRGKAGVFATTAPTPPARAASTGCHNNGWTGRNPKTEKLILKGGDTELPEPDVWYRLRSLAGFNHRLGLQILFAGIKQQPVLALAREYRHPGFQISSFAPGLR